MDSHTFGAHARATALISDQVVVAWEIASVASSILIGEWMLASAAGFSKAIVAIPVGLALSLILLSHVAHRESLREIGFRFDNFFRALSLLAPPAVTVAGLCLIVGWVFSVRVDFLRWNPDRSPGLQLVLYLGWVLAQQYVLQGFFNRRIMSVLGTGWRSILVVAALFGLLHLPNPWIAIITFVAGAIWAAVYQRAPNLFALALTHAVMTWFVISTLPSWVLLRMRVGIGFFG